MIADDRLQALTQWVRDHDAAPVSRVEPASADASFRRYFRVFWDDGRSLVAMDAPPDKEDSRPFIEIAARLEAAGLHVPQIFAADLEQGFLLLEDLGTTAYLAALDSDSADRLYGDALDALFRMQRSVEVDGLPRYDRELLMREMDLFPDWLLERHLDLALGDDERDMLRRVFELLVDNALEQPVVCVHRDYHSRNLMVLGERNPGVIDFQDAVAGPLTYDLVSLLRDCYIRWPSQQVDSWLERYHRRLGDEGRDWPTFRRWFDRMGVQRHLKAAGIFARLNHRDGKPGYLADIPRTLAYIVEVAERDGAIAPLADFLLSRLAPEWTTC
jgi:aminoglycoside/choline kinase family phosphotransferase